jgi:hypothetical protein
VVCSGNAVAVLVVEPSWPWLLYGASSARRCAVHPVQSLLDYRVTRAYSPDVSCAGVFPSLAFTAAAFDSERRRGLGNGLLTRAADVVFVPLGVLALRLTQEGFNLICFLVVSSLLAQV